MYLGKAAQDYLAKTGKNDPKEESELARKIAGIIVACEEPVDITGSNHVQPDGYAIDGYSESKVKDALDGLESIGVISAVPRKHKRPLWELKKEETPDGEKTNLYLRSHLIEFLKIIDYDALQMFYHSSFIGSSRTNTPIFDLSILGNYFADFVGTRLNITEEPTRIIREAVRDDEPFAELRQHRDPLRIGRYNLEILAVGEGKQLLLLGQRKILTSEEMREVGREQVDLYAAFDFLKANWCKYAGTNTTISHMFLSPKHVDEIKEITDYGTPKGIGILHFKELLKLISQGNAKRANSFRIYL